MVQCFLELQTNSNMQIRRKIMNAEKATKLILIISLGFAAAIVFSSFFLPNNDDMQAITFVLLTLWLIPFSYLLKLKNKATQEPHCSKEEQ